MSEETKENAMMRLFRLQNEMPFITKGNTVKKKDGGKMYDYEDLNSILAELQPLLFKHELMLTFDEYIDVDNEGCPISTGVVGRLICPHSERVVTFSRVAYPFNHGALDMQKKGGLVTYARRYVVKNLFNLATTDDDAQGLTLVSGQATEYKIPMKGFKGKTLAEVDIKALEKKIKAAVEYCKKEDRDQPDWMPELLEQLSDFKIKRNKETK